MAYLLFALGVIISSGLAVFAVFGAKVFVIVTQVIGHSTGSELYGLFVVVSSFVVSLLLLADVLRLYKTGMPKSDATEG